MYVRLIVFKPNCHRSVSIHMHPLIKDQCSWMFVQLNKTIAKIWKKKLQKYYKYLKLSICILYIPLWFIYNCMCCFIYVNNIGVILYIFSETTKLTWNALFQDLSQYWRLICSTENTVKQQWIVLVL